MEINMMKGQRANCCIAKPMLCLDSAFECMTQSITAYAVRRRWEDRQNYKLLRIKVQRTSADIAPLRQRQRRGQVCRVKIFLECHVQETHVRWMNNVHDVHDSIWRHKKLLLNSTDSLLRTVAREFVLLQSLIYHLYLLLIPVFFRIAILAASPVVAKNV